MAFDQKQKCTKQLIEWLHSLPDVIVLEKLHLGIGHLDIPETIKCIEKVGITRGYSNKYACNIEARGGTYDYNINEKTPTMYLWKQGWRE